MPTSIRLASLTGLSLFGLIHVTAAQSVVQFCGEILPANQPAISQKWLKVLSRQAGQAGYLTRLKQRASVVFPVIEPIIAQYDIPADFKYLPLVESGGQNHTVSRRGAAGFWQLMPQTARSLGLSVAQRRDERYDLRKSTSAACRYLRELYQQLGSWTLVATAYNAGPNYVQALHRRFPDQHALALPFQTPETQSYVFQAVALKELFTKPQDYPTYLSESTISLLSAGNPAISEAELAALEREFGVTEATTLNLASTLELEAEATENDSAAVAVAPVPVEPLAPQLETRSVSGEPLSEGQLCLFEVIRPITINGVAIMVGDLIYAHVETLNSGRAFLRTEKVVSAQTQETIKLQLVAVEKTRQPGVPIPARDTLTSGWKLIWEHL
ncbi:MAG: lytic transglycosylase domain-containing protein [Bacteroidetes bacterium]|nr:lytic transglycosylase domain-containing protein [Fibrella sp.]